MNELPTWLGTLPGWINAAGVFTALGLWLRYLTQRRAQDGARLTDLEKENRQLRRDFDEYRKSCVKETDELRDLITGLRAQMGQMQLRELEKEGAHVPPATKRAFGRVK